MAIYPWMITFTDITDQTIKKLTDQYLTSRPDLSNNYYDLTATEFISFINSFGVDVTSMNNQDRTTRPVHYLVTQWLINCFCKRVSQDIIGFNNDDMLNDKWKYKYNIYKDELKNLASKMTYEIILSGTMQNNYTRSANTFDIMI
jgi:hypothetical protein